MAAPDPDRLTTALRKLLAATVASLTAPPPRQFLSAGEPAADCEQVCTYAQPASVATLPQPSEIPAKMREPRVRLVTLVAEVHREVCATENPTAAQLDSDGEQHAEDGWALLAGLTFRISTEDIFAGMDPAVTAANVDIAEVLNPSGGMAGWRASVRVLL